MNIDKSIKMRPVKKNLLLKANKGDLSNNNDTFKLPTGRKYIHMHQQWT